MQCLQPWELVRMVLLASMARPAATAREGHPWRTQQRSCRKRRGVAIGYLRRNSSRSPTKLIT
eukprot:scaffold20628_cov65-Phaeocystis_antarctica.AAC.3